MVEGASIYYHFWGGLLRPTFDDPSFHNDFARWSNDALHSLALAERLSVIDPTDHSDLESLRAAVLDVVEEELDTTDSFEWTPRERRFHFIRSQIVIFDTSVIVDEPDDLTEAVASMSKSSVFYHFVDARRRTPNGVDDFSTWLTDLDVNRHRELCTCLQSIDPFFKTLAETRTTLIDTFERFLGEEAGS